MPATTNPVTEMRKAFDGLINQLDMAEERLAKLEHISVDCPHPPTEKQR